MKTVEFNLAVWKAHVAGKPIGKSFIDGTYLCDELKDSSGTYVLASEAADRVKVLEDALIEMADCDSFFRRIELKNKAMEVKP
jgi:hypothetical protein